MTQVETEPSRHAAGAPPARVRSDGRYFPAALRRTGLEGAADYAFRQYRTEIYRYLRRKTKNAADAEELTQQVFTDAAVTLSRMEGNPGSLLGLLYTITHRRFADEARRNGHRDERVPLEGIDVELPTARYGGDVARAIRDAIAQLPGEQRQVVCMRLIRGCSFAEIATLIGLSEAAAKMRFQRGLAMRRALECQGIQPDARGPRIGARPGRADALPRRRARTVRREGGGRCDLGSRVALPSARRVWCYTRAREYQTAGEDAN